MMFNIIQRDRANNNVKYGAHCKYKARSMKRQLRKMQNMSQANNKEYMPK